MSDFIARSALARMNLRDVAIARHYAGFESDMRFLAEADQVKERQSFIDRRGEMCDAFGLPSRPQSKPFAFSNGLAVIPVTGTLLNRFNSSYGSVTGYNFIRSQLNAALLDDDVKGIVFDVNSFGGECAGCFELSDDIYASRQIKPSISVVDSNAYSAGYAVGSSASRMVVTPSGGTGSIGVVAMHMDVSGLLKQFGVKVTFIHFGDHKVDGNPFEPLSEEVTKSMQASVNKSGETFVALVARNRGIDAKVVRDTQAGIFRAEEALSLGLIDAIATPSQALQVFFDELSGSTSTTAKEGHMTTEANAQPGATDQATKDAAAAQAATAQAKASADAAAAAKTAERSRVKGIMGCEEAKGKQALASHLAMDTEMTVEAAQAVLKVAAPEASATEGAGKGNGFQAAMNNGQNPNVGANGSGGNDESNGADPKAKANAILAAQQMATGRKPLTAVK